MKYMHLRIAREGPKKNKQAFAMLQGETPRSIICTSLMDMMLKECDIEPVRYKDEVRIPKLSFVDVLVDIHISDWLLCHILRCLSRMAEKVAAN